MDAIKRLEKQWKRRVSQALTVLKPICTQKLPIMVRETSGDFSGCTAESPESFQSFQSAIKAFSKALETLPKIL